MNVTLLPAATASAHIEREHYKTTIRSGNHTVYADEPVTNNGQDIGMSPSQLLLASLGACTSITLRMYIDRKMWVVDEISVELELFKTESGTLINRKISFQGNINQEQHDRLIQIANQCPIHKLLTGNIQIATT